MGYVGVVSDDEEEMSVVQETPVQEVKPVASGLKELDLIDSEVAEKAEAADLLRASDALMLKKRNRYQM